MGRWLVEDADSLGFEGNWCAQLPAGVRWCAHTVL